MLCVGQFTAPNIGDDIIELFNRVALNDPGVTIHVAIGHFRFVPMLLLLHETITSLGSNLGTHCPFNTLYSNPRWDPCTVRARSPFPIPPHIYTTLPVYTFPHSEY